MDDVVAIKFEDRSKGVGAVLIWGRVFDAVDPTRLLAAVRPHLTSYGVADLLSIEVCSSIRDVQAFPYFYEGVMAYAAALANKPHRGKAWKKKHRSAEAVGRDLWFLGFIS